MTQKIASMSDATEIIFSKFGRQINLATPLGLGKPNILLNTIYEKARQNPSINLSIYTALSLTLPHQTADLARRFFEPFQKRQWGENYPELKYEIDAIRGELPPNIKVHEFYFQAGAALNSENLQRRYQSINYTHVAESIVQAEVGVIVQAIAQKRVGQNFVYSLSCNPDLTLDVVDLFKNKSQPLMVVGVIHPDLPFLSGEAEVPESFFDLIVDDPRSKYELFALPKTPIDETDHSIGFYASQLIVDDGTLQIGIGSLSEAVTAALIIRQNQNPIYSNLAKQAWKDIERPKDLKIETHQFTAGLYGLSEMVTDGFMYLREAKILKRHVIDEKSGVKTYLHGAFFLGSKEFYSWLRSLKGDDYSGLRMGRVSKVNDLYDPHEITLRRQRINPRFLNTCMQATLLGAVASETLEDGRVVSGVGGQYNFVAMSQELKNSRSILMLRSTRENKGKRKSNIVWSHGQLTIPRHLRDIVITEYGVADIRNRSDEAVIKAMLNITDSEFQRELLKIAKNYRKIESNYEIPLWAQNNTPEKVKEFISAGRKQGAFQAYPFGSDFTPVEERLIPALSYLKGITSKWNKTIWTLLKILNPLLKGAMSFKPELERMNLHSPKTLNEWISQRLLLLALRETRIFKNS